MIILLWLIQIANLKILVYAFIPGSSIKNLMPTRPFYFIIRLYRHWEAVSAEFGLNASAFCSELASRLYQWTSNATASSVFEQLRDVRTLTWLKTLVFYQNAQNKFPCVAIGTAFPDADREQATAKVCYDAGIFLGEIEKPFIFHFLSWSSLRERRPVWFTRTSDLLAVERQSMTVLSFTFCFLRFIS